MAIFHLSAKTISRASGRSAVGAAAYRDGIKLKNERDGIIHDYTRRNGVEDNFIIQPDGVEWATNAEKLWNAVEIKERRKDATTAREYEISLPNELNNQQRKELAQEFAQHIVNTYGVIADVAIHSPTKDGDGRNHHAHILTTTRTATPDGLDKKTRILDGRKTGSQEIENLRKTWAEMVNNKLEENNINQRIDHRSYERQGIEQSPQIHMGWRATHAERDNIKKELKITPNIKKEEIKPVTVRGQKNENIKTENIALKIANKAIEQAKQALQQAQEFVAKIKNELKQSAREREANDFFTQLGEELKQEQQTQAESFFNDLEKELKEKQLKPRQQQTQPPKWGNNKPAPKPKRKFRR